MVKHQSGRQNIRNLHDRVHDPTYTGDLRDVVIREIPRISAGFFLVADQPSFVRSTSIPRIAVAALATAITRGARCCLFSVTILK